MSWSDISKFLFDNPTIAPLFGTFVALIAIPITAILTYRGWKVAHDNASRLEQQRNENAFRLEQQRNETAFKLEQQRNDNAFRLESRRAKHKYVSDQIKYLYGPLMSLCTARDGAMNELIRLQRPDLKGKTRDFFDKTERTPEQLKQWRLWREVVFLPLLVKMQETVVQNAHLIDGTKLPPDFGNLMAHVSTYNAIIKNWADVIEKDQKDNTSKIDEQQKNLDGVYETVVPHLANENFPRKFQTAVEAEFEKLKLKQAELINDA
jgi:hypothetical protein